MLRALHDIPAGPHCHCVLATEDKQAEQKQEEAAPATAEEPEKGKGKGKKRGASDKPETEAAREKSPAKKPKGRLHALHPRSATTDKGSFLGVWQAGRADQEHHLIWLGPVLVVLSAHGH